MRARRRDLDRDNQFSRHLPWTNDVFLQSENEARTHFYIEIVYDGK